MTETTSYIPEDRKMHSLGFVPPETRTGIHPSKTYYRANRSQAVVVWSNREVRLGSPNIISGWDSHYDGRPANEQEFDALLTKHFNIAIAKSMTHHQVEIEYTGSFEPPHYATHGSAGFDLRAELSESYTLAPGQRAKIYTGISIKLPQRHEMQVRPRSGLALKTGITVLNTPGTVDEDFWPNEVAVILINHGTEPYTIQPGERIAQAVIARYEIVPALFTSATKERTGGLGSTGK